MSNYVQRAVIENDKPGHGVPVISVIIPVFNERKTVASVLELVLEQEMDKEVIIVDDGSTDGSAEAICQWIAGRPWIGTSTTRIVWLQHPTNLGKGMALRSGLELAQGLFVIPQDSDLEVSPACYGSLMRPLLDGCADFVLGRRRNFLIRSTWAYAAGVLLLNVLVRGLYGYNVSDAACCFKVLPRDRLLAMNLEAEAFEFCPEVVAKASRLGLRLKQVDVDYLPRRMSEGKKLRLVSDGLEAVHTLWRYRHWQPTAERGKGLFSLSEQSQRS